MAHKAHTNNSFQVPESDIRTRVALWKIKTGRSQQELAEELGISPSYLSQIISGHRPGRSTVEQLRQVTRDTACI